MNVSVKKNKKIASNKKISKKEIEIPIYIVDNSKKKEIKLETAGSQKEVFFDSEQIFAKKEFNKADSEAISDFIPRLPDINSFQLGKTKFAGKENRPNLAELQPVKSFSKPKILPKIENLSDEKRKILMWVLVVFLTSFIFLGWFLMLRHNLFVERSENKTNIFAEIKQDWVDIPKFWQENNFLKPPSALSAEETNKLKEKVLETVNEKNKLNQEENKVEENIIRE